jgi:hypothetical protein
MKPINQIKLSLTIGILVIIIPLSGFPQSFKTLMLVGLGIILIYVKVIALHAEKMKRPKKASVNRGAHTFVENRPQHLSAPDAKPEEYETLE